MQGSCAIREGIVRISHLLTTIPVGSECNAYQLTVQLIIHQKRGSNSEVSYPILGVIYSEPLTADLG